MPDFQTVEVRGLVKMYGATRALAGVDGTFRAGEVTAVEGPNGSGKSTLLTLVAQLGRPTRGQVRYGSRRPGRSDPALRARIGMLGHASMLYPDLTGRENLELFARLYAVRDAGRRVDTLLERFEIGRFVERPVRTWSRGQLQRVALARALLHEPRLLLLDEPSTGLDVRAMARLTDAIRQERARGAIVVLVTHDRAFADQLADRRLGLARGRVTWEDT